MTVFEKIIQQLEENNIEYHLSEHQPVRTSEEAANVRGVDINSGAKAMVVKSKDDYILLVLPAGHKINWKKVKATLNVKDIRFATVEEAENVTGVKMGSVPPFGNILEIPTIYDNIISQIQQIHFNPGSNTHSISMKTRDLLHLVKPTITSII
jgi:prolyl-tRNA editing enzyme YbaK/EbsC (Cys-tRNA(Pro) deacylase)